ncbi:MAG: transcription antitermination factor NusB [Bryobacteraceae bacterium]
MPISPARTTAFDILRRVEGGAWASDLLASATAEMDWRDAGLASEIVMGSLRRQAQLDWLIAHFAGRRAALDIEVRIALRMGIYQLRYLERVPAHAAVGESVELVKRARKRSAAGFVNAVLRKVHRVPVAWPDRATALSMPEWLLERWEQQFGPETAERIARAFLVPPETFVRVTGPPPEGVELKATEIPGCYRVVAGDPRGLRIQDIGSQAIVPLLDLAPGQRFLDLCAAPGNKTSQAMEYGVRAIAGDRNLHRLRNLQAPECARVVLDGTLPLPFKTQFDRILLDAPCSGTGTLGRNPEIRWRIQPKNLVELHARQAALLRNALAHLRPGGRLVYSTCSLEREENEDVLEEVLGGLPAARMRRTPGIEAGDGFFAAVIPSG